MLTGALYLLCVWMLLGPDRLIPEVSMGGSRGRLAELFELLGPVTTLGVMTLISYFIGTFAIVRRWPRRIFWGFNSWKFQRFSRQELVEFWRSKEIFHLVWFTYEIHWLEPLNPTYWDGRADGLGTPMAVRRTADWTGELDNWVRRETDKLHRKFTYADLYALNPPDDFTAKIRESWSEFRDFTIERANNELEFRNGDWESAGHYFDLRDDQIPPWPPGPTGWVKEYGHPWMEFDKSRDETVQRHILGDSLLGTIDLEIRRIVARMRADGAKLYDEYDRKTSEAEIRYSISIPLTLLVLILAIQTSPLLLACLAIPAALLKQGFRSERESLVDLFDALQYGAIASPTVELMRQAATDHSKRLETQVH